jgi:hypothetical protein
MQTPGVENAAREREGLFDIVSWTEMRCCPHPEERACASASAKSNARARVSKDEDAGARRILAERTQRVLLRSSPRKRGPIIIRRWLWVPALAGRRPFGSREAPTCGCTKRSQGQCHCFRIVIYNDFCNSDVSAASRAQDFCKATRSQTCRFIHRASPSHRGVRWRACCAAKRTAPERCKAVLRPTAVGSFTPAESCEELAPWLQCHRNHLKTVARSRFASRPGGWLRLSRPTQSLMTLA